MGDIKFQYEAKKIKLQPEVEKWDITDKNIIGDLIKKHKTEFTPYKEEHYKILREAICMHLDKYSDEVEIRGYINSQKARFSTGRTFNSYALFTNLIGLFIGIFSYASGFDKTVALWMIILFSIAAVWIYYIKDCTPKNSFYMFLLEDIENNYIPNIEKKNKENNKTSVKKSKVKKEKNNNL